MTLEQFRASSDHVSGLREFLSSETGGALISVLHGLHPMRVLADSRQVRDGNNIRAIAAAESELGRAENILGRCEGYESVLELMMQIMTQHHAVVAPKSRKGGAEIRPAAAPGSN